MATYKETELGQVQQSLNCTNQKLRRRVAKTNKIKTEIKALKDKASDELSQREKVKLSRLEFEYQHELADVVALRDEVKALKDLQTKKRAIAKKKKSQIFDGEDDNECNMNDDDILANLYGTRQEETGTNVAFENM